MEKLVVMVGNTSWGMLKFRSSLINSFILKGHKVVVIAPEDEWSDRLIALGAEFIGLNVDRKGINPLTDLKYIIELTNHFFSIKPDVVLTYTIKPVIYGSIAAKLAKVRKSVAISTGLGFVFSKKSLVQILGRLLYRIAMACVDEAWFLNQEDAQFFRNHQLVRQDKIFVLSGEGVDVDVFPYTPKYSSPLRFVMISRMLWDKGVGLYVELAHQIKKENPEIEFLLAGPVDQGNPMGISPIQLQEWHKSGHVIYLGALDDIKPTLERSSCVVHPTFYKEGLPLILLEAGSMGVPTITTNIAGCRDVVRDGYNGLLTEPEDVDDLVIKVKRFIRMTEEDRVNMGKNARDLVEKTYSSLIINSIYSEKLGL